MKKILFASFCLLFIINANAQPAHNCSIRPPKHYKIIWNPGPGAQPPTLVAYNALVVAAANAWNTAWTLAGKPGALLVSDGNVDTPCHCFLGANQCVTGLGNLVNCCTHTAPYTNSVALCRDPAILGANCAFPYLYDTVYNAPDDALAVTFYSCDTDCMQGADICVEFAFLSNCSEIPWYTSMGAPALPPGGQFDMYSVLVHEFGHYLGLGHSANAGDVMFPSISQGQVKRVPQVGEVNVIQICPNPPATPTLSEWGLITFTLLLLSLGMVFLYKRQNANTLVMACAIIQDVKPSLFESRLYFKTLSIILLIAVSGLAVARWYFGILSIIDSLGTLACSFIIAYIVQLWALMSRR